MNGSKLSRQTLPWVALAVMLATEIEAGQTRPPDDDMAIRAPQRMSVAVHGSPVEFLDALKAEGVPCGLYLREDTWEEVRFVSTLPDDQSDWPADALTRLGDVLGAFRASHPGWQADIASGGVVLREDSITPRNEVVAAFSVINTRLDLTFVAAERLLLPSIPEVGGCVGSILGTPPDHTEEGPGAERQPVGQGPKPSEPLAMECGQPLVTVNVRGVTFEALLSEVAATAPGTAWVLVRRRDPWKGEFDTLSLRYPENRSSDHHWPLWVKSARSTLQQR